MRRTLVVTTLGALIAACSDEGGGAALEDAGETATHEDAQVDAHKDAATREDDGGTRRDDSGTSAAMDASALSDAGSSDAGRTNDAGQDARASGGDAGMTSVDGGSAGSGCAGKTYKLCEDFESANTGALPAGWSYAGDGMTNRPSIVTDQAHSGTKSLRSADQTNGQARITKALSTLGATANKHWGRVFYRIKSPPHLPPALYPVNHPVLHNTMVALSRPTSRPEDFSEWRVVDTIVNQQGKHVFALNIPDDSCCGETGYDYTSYDGKWHCAEWFIDVAAQQFRFFYDGADLRLTAKPTGGQAETLTQVVLGWVSYQKTAAPFNQAWLDDLAIDDNRIGCD